MHDPGRLIRNKIGGDIGNSSRDCKLLDFDGHLAKKEKTVRDSDKLIAAVGGSGREFINLDELI